jgi:two-component system, LytTR family, response regulator
VRALIVDDEPLARSGVAVRLSQFPDVEIVGECGDGPSAIETIVDLSPDVVFLDVQMPGMDGFEVLKALPSQHLPSVIFLTAYEQHALRAFEVHALDYLLKPLDDERFRRAVERARRMKDTDTKIQMSERILGLLGENSGRYVSRFPVRTGSRIQVVLADDIEWIAAAGDYVELHCGARHHLLRETMNSIEQKLDPAKFLRIHRSRIVRLTCVRELYALENREYLVRLSDGSEHRSSRRYADHLANWLSPQEP